MENTCSTCEFEFTAADAGECLDCEHDHWKPKEKEIIKDCHTCYFWKVDGCFNDEECYNEDGWTLKIKNIKKITPKESDGKARFDLIPPYPLFELAKVYNMGNDGKYPRRSWEEGIPFGDSFRSLMSHVMRWQDGEDYDPETGLHHLAHASYWCFAIMQFQVTHPEMDDRSKHRNLLNRKDYKQTWKMNEDFHGKKFEKE